MSDTGVRKLTEGKIFRQLIELAMPLMATSFIQMAYTLTDMAWLGRLSSEHVAAVGAVGILTWLTTSFALITKIGSEIGIARSIGSNRPDKARVYASHNVTIALILGVVIALCVILSGPFIVSFFKLEAHISTLSTSYLQIVSAGLPLYFMSLTFTGIYNGAGRTTIPFYLMSAGLVCNMLLDPLLIMGIGRFEGWGTQGAAIATLISQSLVFLLFVWQMKRSNGILNRFPYFVRLQSSYTRHIFQLGTPIALGNAFFASISFCIARIASIEGGHLGVMSQATGNQIEGITWNTSQGFSTALGTFVAQNYAAGRLDRTRKAYRYTLISLLSIGILVTAAFLLFGEEIFSLFVPDEPEARIAGGEYLFVAAFCQMFMMLEATTLGMWNGYGKTTPPAIVSISLNLARIPLALWLSSFMGITGVWIAITISAILKGIVSPVWFMANNKK